MTQYGRQQGNVVNTAGASLSPTADLKELERKAYRLTHQDGLWDMMLGLLLIGLGLSVLVEDAGFGETAGMVVILVADGIGMGLLIAGKRLLTVPRMGIVRFGPARKRRLAGVIGFLSISVALGLVLAVAIGSGRLDLRKVGNMWVPMFWFLNALMVLGAMAYLLDFGRLYIIAILFASSVPILEVMKANFDSPFNGLVAFVIPGLIVVALGAFILRRFLLEYPLPPREVQDGIQDG